MFAPTDGGPPGIAAKLAAGAASAALRTLLFYPLDLARVRITADITSHGMRAYPTVRACLASTARREGITGMYRGLSASLLHVVPCLSLSLVAYDEFKVSVD